MTTTKQIAKHFRDVHFGGNWTSVNLKDTITGIGWQEATREVKDLNTIAKLVYHINYYVSAVLKVLEGGPLEAHDKHSFDVPSIQSQEDWERLLTKTWDEAERFAKAIEALPDDQLSEIFIEEKYGTYHRNLLGIIEHTHYHLGQIVILKKLLLN